MNILKEKISGDPKHGDPTNLEEIKEIDFTKRFSLEGLILVDEKNLPINPKENPTANGKGTLWYLGPNHAADPIVTTWINGSPYILLITRQNGELAFPGGMKDQNENHRQTAERELEEETSVKLDFSKAKIIYSGIVYNDPRNTQNAWIETVAFHLHIKNGEKLKIKAGDDAKKVEWVAIEEIKKGRKKLYAYHGEILKMLDIYK